MKVGQIVTPRVGSKVGKPHVVVHEPVMSAAHNHLRVKLCYCGSSRWYMPQWHSLTDVTEVVIDSPALRRCRKLLAAARASAPPDGWIRVQAGRYGQPGETVIVGHIDIASPA